MGEMVISPVRPRASSERATAPGDPGRDIGPLRQSQNVPSVDRFGTPERRAMRLPRMTTRRWMATIAAISVAFGGYFEVVRLKRLRGQFLRISRDHTVAEGFYRRLGSLRRDLAWERKWAERSER